MLKITGLENDRQLVVWDSVPGVNYRLLATTNLSVPMQVVSPQLRANGASSFYFDATTNAPGKFYRVKVTP